MGWLWGSGDSSAAKDQLDPSLRDFLEKEAPTGRQHLPLRPEKEQTPRPTAPSFPVQKESSEAQKIPTVPAQSQFQDGRYAHLWKGYTPQSVLESRGKNEQDKLRDVVDAFNERKGSIGQIALENCALEYLDQFNCFKSPNWKQTATICREESRKFNRCYEIQSKFLKALGYMSLEPRTREEDERIQMHADKLYQQMLEQEQAIAKAKEEGKPIPKFESVLSKRNIQAALGGRPSVNRLTTDTEVDKDDENDVWSNIRPESRAEYEKKISELPTEDQDFERKALIGELRAKRNMTKKVEAAFIEERMERMKRRDAGQATLGDTIKRWWGWG